MSTHEAPVLEPEMPTDQESVTFSGHARKKILFVTNSKEYGGLERHVLCVVRGLFGSGFQQLIFNSGPDLYTSRLDPQESNQISVMSKTERMSFWDWVKLFRDVQPDVIVFEYGWVGDFPFASWAAWLAGVRRRFAIQHFLTPLPPSVEKRSFRLLQRWFGGRTRRIVRLRLSASFYNKTICVSNSVRESLVRDYRFQAGKTITIYNWVSVSEFFPSQHDGTAVRNRLGVGPGEFLLISSARLSEVKRIDILLEAVAQVLGRGVSCKCIILGDGPLKQQLLEQAQQMNLSGHVFFEGFQGDVRPYLQASSAFVLTSRAEGLPLAILEAMACGLPCVVTDVGGNAEAIIHNFNGLVVPSGSVNAVAEAITYLATHPQERTEMSKRARARACEVFDIDRSMSNIVRVILS